MDEIKNVIHDVDLLNREIAFLNLLTHFWNVSLK